MPRTRFFKLEQEKQDKICDVALQEFGTHGYEEASMNSIIKKSGISKGAMYYYFDNKRDIYIYSLVKITKSMGDFFPETFDHQSPEEFWDYMAKAGALKTEMITKEPVVFRFLKEFIYEYHKDPSPYLEITSFFIQMMRSIVEAGQKVGAIRTDLPLDLIVNLLFGMGLNLDAWLFSKNDSLENINIKSLVLGYLELLRGVFQPGFSIREGKLDIFNEC
jgi:AcrR family transcriptional regulator